MEDTATQNQKNVNELLEIKTFYIFKAKSSIQKNPNRKIVTKMNNENASLPSANELRNYIAKGETQLLLDILNKNLSHFEPNIQNRILIISGQFQNIESDNIKGIISIEEYSVQRNKIAMNLLEIINEIDEPRQKVQKKTQTFTTKKRKQTPYDKALEKIALVRKEKENNLDLSGLRLSEIPKEINSLESIQELNLQGNRIKKIQHIDRLVQLRTLALDDNEISKIENLNFLNNLTVLSLSNNPITRIENFENLVKLETLFLANCQIKKIENLETLIKLESLFLAHNSIKQIQGLENLKNLTFLFLDNNQIEKIENLDALKKLQTLQLHNNNITKIENLGKLPILFELHLDNNKISVLDGLGNLKKLERLYIHNNQIRLIGDLNKMRKLEILTINKNQINYQALSNNHTFFNFLESRKSDFTLHIDHNPFLEQIKSLKIEDYPNEEPYNHYSAFLQDKTLILTDIESELEEVILPHKLVLLGNSNAGKSSLVDFLKSNKLQDGKPKASTEVLDIIEWKPKGKPQFLIYDFGGQDYYHATYQMFFSEEASYLLLWSKDSNRNFFNSEKTDQRPEDYYCFDVNYWLGNIKYLNDTVNINTEEENPNRQWYKNLLLVENKIDLDFDNPYPLKADDIFGEIEQFKISLWKNANEDILFKNRRKWLKDFIQSLHPRVSMDSSLRAQAIRDYLSEWQALKKVKNEWRFQELKEYLKNKYDSWKKLADEGDDEVSRILNRFNVSGLIIWYRNVPKLKDRIWVNPNKLQEPILKLLNHEKIKPFHGKVPIKDFNEIVEFELYRDLLMQKQIITFDEHDQVYIIPQKLKLNTDDDPLYQIATQGLTSSFTIRFKNFMPLGIMNRLIRMFGKISDRKYYSRYEMIFSLDRNKVLPSVCDEKILLQCDMENLSISISVNKDSEDLWKEIFTRILLAYHRKEDHPNEVSTTLQSQSAVQQNINISSSFTTPTIFNFDHLIPLDLQVSLDDEFFVEYRELKDAVAANHKKVRATNDQGDIEHFKTYLFNAFFTEEIKKPKKVFISYSHDDIEQRRELQKYLINMERDNLIEVWQDGMIQPGMDWDLTIKENLEKADIIILLVSQSFIASNYIHEVELKKAIEKQRQGTGVFFPILLKNCDFVKWKALPKDVSDGLKDKAQPFYPSDFQFLPQNKEQRLLPINTWQYPEDAWVQINDKLRDILGN